jgi:RNA polymerase sigma-70 factor (ECF subfamily)
VVVHGVIQLRAAVAKRPNSETYERPTAVSPSSWIVPGCDGEVYAIAALTLHNGRITSMDILLDPARLARLDLTAVDSRP